jgi:hypothetical protein
VYQLTNQGRGGYPLRFPPALHSSPPGHQSEGWIAECKGGGIGFALMRISVAMRKMRTPLIRVCSSLSLALICIRSFKLRRSGG